MFTTSYRLPKRRSHKINNKWHFGAKKSNKYCVWKCFGIRGMHEGEYGTFCSSSFKNSVPGGHWYSTIVSYAPSKEFSEQRQLSFLRTHHYSTRNPHCNNVRSFLIKFNYYYFFSHCSVFVTFGSDVFFL